MQERVCMKFDKVLNHRRSIRRYLDTPVDRETIRQVIKAAILAPSWKNSQSARWYVVTNDALLEQIRENALPEFNARNCEKAPVLIVSCFENGRSGRDNEGNYANEANEGWSYFDNGLACENLLLEAKAKGLGTLVMGIRNEAALRTILSIPENLTIVAVIAMGYPDIDPKMPKRNKIKEAAVFFE